jgi:hypothetical protein
LPSNLIHSVDFSQASSGGTDVEYLTTDCEIKGLHPEENSGKNKQLLTGLNLGHCFNYRGGCMHAIYSLCSITKLPNLELTIWSK